MNDLIKIDVDGNPYVSSQTISDEFGREHKNVLNSIRDLISSGHINRLDFKLIASTSKLPAVATSLQFSIRRLDASKFG